MQNGIQNKIPTELQIGEGGLLSFFVYNCLFALLVSSLCCSTKQSKRISKCI
ncbi:hypothetical protein HMPREF9144_2387 [Prevotella pallens ATCC 700821]|uniref:Uncharacterized protein n=1 Tax=Prevotella pallens ATCC 700821 TaxID=997353 RepID=F9DL45_9BACT|nr:hypothetical protein HMPREF9144_2387 [Prevotella pallens ATCC 700821]